MLLYNHKGKQKGELKMIKYELVKRHETFKYSDRLEIMPGCAGSDPDPEVIETFDSKEKALAALKKYKSQLWKEETFSSGTQYHVAEWSVEENEYDEDGEFKSYVGTWDWSPMKIEVTVMPSYDVIGTYSTMRDAQEAANSYGGEYENIKIL